MNEWHFFFFKFFSSKQDLQKSWFHPIKHWMMIKQIELQLYFILYFRFAEIVVLLNFVLLALLWVTRKPGFIPGWNSLFDPGLVAHTSCLSCLCDGFSILCFCCVYVACNFVFFIQDLLFIHYVCIIFVIVLAFISFALCLCCL